MVEIRIRGPLEARFDTPSRSSSWRRLWPHRPPNPPSQRGASTRRSLAGYRPTGRPLLEFAEPHAAEAALAADPPAANTSAWLACGAAPLAYPGPGQPPRQAVEDAQASWSRQPSALAALSRPGDRPAPQYPPAGGAARVAAAVRCLRRTGR